MMDEYQKQETMERYLTGAMNEAERTDFESQLLSDPSLHKELALERAARLLVSEAGREKLAVRLISFEDEWQASRRTKILPMMGRRLLAAAAILLALVAAYLWFFEKQTPQQQNLFATYFEPYRPLSPERGEAATPSTWQSATTAYATNDYRQAAILFENSLQDSTSIAYLGHFYIGMSLLAQEPPQAAAALPHFDIVLGNDNDYRQQAMWYKALTLVNLGQRVEAKRILEEIIKGKLFNWIKAKSVYEGL